VVGSVGEGAVSGTAVEKLIRSARLSRPETVEALSPLYDDPSAAAAAENVLRALKPGEVERLVPVLRLLEGTDEHVEPFAAFLAHPDGSLRLIAARSLVERGDARGLSVLVDLLGHDDADRSARAPAPVWVGAATALAASTGQLFGPPFDSDQPTRANCQTHWRDWLRDHPPTYSQDRGEWI
jgi:hypothetical protein